MIGMEGGAEGYAAHWSAADIFDLLRPARAMVLSGELGTERCFRASRITYFPVNPDAPNMIIS